MYFNNRPTARENELIHLGAIAKAVSFEEHQMATAMFLMTFVNNVNTNTEGWVQNELLGYMAPETRRNCMHLDLITGAVRRTLEGYGPQTAAGEALILIDEELAKDSRFAGIPVGTVAMFRGVLNTDRWGITAGKARRLVIPGYFVSPEEFVVVDPIMAGSYLQGVTRWHGGEDTVGHLRQHGEKLKLMNRPLSETYALAETYHEHPDKNATLWLKKGMRFELRPAASSLSRILTPPEDTEPQTVRVNRTGTKQMLEAMLAPTASALLTAWAMTDLPQVLRYDGNYSGGLDGAAKVLQDVLKHDTSLCLDRNEAKLMLIRHGCDYVSPRRLLGSDNLLHDFDPHVTRFTYGFSNIGNSPFIYGSAEAHYAFVLGLLGFINKYKLPPESFLGLMKLVATDVSPSASHNNRIFNMFLLKLPLLFNTECNAVKASYLLGETRLGELVTDTFVDQRIAVSRATYHDGLNTKQRKKLLAKFFPTV